MMQKSYVVCTTKPWNIAAYARRAAAFSGNWQLITSPDQLSPELLEKIAPRYVFFPHWSWRVPASFTRRYECVCFHMTDVPYGRGGSPLQNLISRGHGSTKLTALRMTEELDAGPVYLKRALSLAGRAEEIFERAADLVYDLIGEIIVREPVPVEQSGETVLFARRAPYESAVPQDGSGISLYNFIRMLDAPTYPRAFLDWGEWRLEFDHPSVSDDVVEAHVVIRKRNCS